MDASLRKEYWRDVIGYEKKYQVSNLGRVRSLDRMVSCHKTFVRKQHGRILKNIPTSVRYFQVNLYNHGNRAFHVHRLVAIAFIPNALNKPQINHKDGNPKNNQVNNLEWCNQSENTLHSYRVLKNKSWQTGKSGEGITTSKAVLQKSKEGKLIRRWPNGLSAVKIGGFESSSISRCVRGLQKIHKGYVWQYE